jgi:hypothetical protein
MGRGICACHALRMGRAGTGRGVRSGRPDQPSRSCFMRPSSSITRFRSPIRWTTNSFFFSVCKSRATCSRDRLPDSSLIFSVLFRREMISVNASGRSPCVHCSMRMKPHPRLATRAAWNLYSLTAWSLPAHASVRWRDRKDASRRRRNSHDNVRDEYNPIVVPHSRGGAELAGSQ